MSEQGSRVWLITGSSTGLGRALSELILEKGEIVVATARTPSTLQDLAEKYSSDRLLIIKLDVTDEEQIAQAFAQAKTAFGRLDVVLNNAGFSNIGEMETMDEAECRSVFEANFWGTFRVSREAIRFLRDVNPPGVGGRLLQMSSYVGLSGYPGLSIYAASKFAIEGMTESVAAELDPDWNIKVSIIEPGWIYSECAKKVQWPAPHPAYSNANLATTTMRKEGFNVEWKDTRRAVEVFYRCASVPDPPLHFVVGRDAIEAARKKVTSLTDTVDRFESWSAGLEP